MPIEAELPTVADVAAAATRIAPHVHRTAVLTCSTFDRELGAELHFKCENFQKVGAFKARGATNAALSLDDAAARCGLITHSSGNHAAAVAYAASIRGTSATVVMPRQAPEVKVRAVRGYGAEIVFCEQHERDAVCERERAARGATFIHPFDDARVIAGQGTAAFELVDQVPDLDLLIAPVGGGGLLSGTTLVARDRGCDVWAAEPEAVDDAYRSLETGVRQPAVRDPETVCDGLLTGLGERELRDRLSRAGADPARLRRRGAARRARRLRSHEDRDRAVVRDRARGTPSPSGTRSRVAASA